MAEVAFDFDDPNFFNPQAQSFSDYVEENPIESMWSLESIQTYSEQYYDEDDPVVQRVGSRNITRDVQGAFDNLGNGGGYTPMQAGSSAVTPPKPSLGHGVTSSAWTLDPLDINEDLGSFASSSKLPLEPLSLASSYLLQDFIQPMELDAMTSPAPLINDVAQQESSDDDDSDDSNSDSEDESDDELSDVPSSLRPRPELLSPPTSPLEEYGMTDYSECGDLPEADEESPAQAPFIVDPPAPSPEFENSPIDCASDLSGVFEDESDDEAMPLAEAGNGELTTPLSERHIIHPHSRRVAVHASTPLVASSSVAHALPMDDEPLTESEPEPEDDDADSDYSPAVASGHSSRRAARKNRTPTRKAPKPLAAASSDGQDSAPSCVKMVIPTTVTGKKRSRSASRPESGKRRKLTDTTSSVVNNPDAAQAPRRARKATTSSPASNGQQPSRPLTSSVKRVRDFAYAFDIDSAYRKVKMSEIEDVRKCILEPKFTGDRTEDGYTYPTAEEWAINVEKFQKIMMKKDRIRKKVTDNWDGRVNKTVHVCQTIDGEHQCPFPDCGYTSKQRKELDKHQAVHVPAECFCPKCLALFGRFDSLDRHFRENPDCKKKANKYQYYYHRRIFSLYYLGLHEKLDICREIFELFAGRSRLWTKDFDEFKFEGMTLLDAKALANGDHQGVPSSS